MNAKTPRRQEEGMNAETPQRGEMREKELLQRSVPGSLFPAFFDPSLLGVSASRRSAPFLFLGVFPWRLGVLAFTFLLTAA
jgi:hypothetical protein